MGPIKSHTTWAPERLCERCGVRTAPRHRDICSVCFDIEAGKSPDIKHLELLRASGRDYAGRKL